MSNYNKAFNQSNNSVHPNILTPALHCWSKVWSIYRLFFLTCRAASLLSNIYLCNWQKEHSLSNLYKNRWKGLKNKKKIHEKSHNNLSICVKKSMSNIWRKSKYFYLSPCGGEASISACEILLEDNSILREKCVCVWFKTKFLAGNFLLVIGWFSAHTHTHIYFAISHWCLTLVDI